ncbi:hypothetical protein [Streptomyces sp. GC420]|uniref:hypothetical protein n=1 Tax=Streptomyces sp. GC420 TaxID=2697568 RepID=UPI001AA175EE|nr:hypothetical protein [Streptomyces sp. GC420]
MALQASTPRRQQANGEARVPAPGGEPDPAEPADSAAAAGAAGTEAAPAEHAPADADPAEPRSRAAAAEAEAAGRGGATAAVQAAAQAGGQTRRRGRAAKRPSGRERHDEKITVYVSAEELMDLEHARLVLRGEHGLAVDRGRIVREAVAVVLADLEARGDASILVRRLRGR